MGLLSMTPETGAVLAQLGAGLLSGNFGAGVANASQYAAGIKQRQMQEQMAQLQMQEAQMKMAEMQRQRDFLANLPDPQMAAGQAALAGGGGPTMANAANIHPVNPMQQMLFQGVKAGAVPLGDYLKTLTPKQIEFGKIDPKDYTPESLRRATATGDYTQLEPVRKMEVVGNRAVNLYDTKPGTIFDQVDPNKPFSLIGGQAQPNQAFQQYELNKARAGKTDVHVNTGQRGLDNELKIRSDFRSEPIYKAHGEVQSAFSQISQALKQQSPAGDMAGATKIMKLLDPGSVVRESELGMAMAATGLLDRATNYAQMVMSGQKLTPKQREDFQNLANVLYAESAKQYNQKRNEYAGFATDYGLNADRIVGPAVTSPKLPQVAPAASAGAPSIDDLLKKYGR